jgi:protoporphyrinogen oxidase
MKKAVIIGTGISGLSIGKMLKDHYDVVLLEKSEKIGGLIKCDRVNGNLFHRVGGHVFNSKNQVVLDWFWQNFDRDNEFLKATRHAKIFLQDQLLGYPLENYLYQLPKPLLTAVISDLIELIKSEKQPQDYDNFKDFLIGNFGKTLFELYFEPYNTKIWNADLSKIPIDWLEGKLPMPNIKEILLSNVCKEEESNMVHSTFYYAKENGSQFIVDRLASGQNIATGVEFNHVLWREEDKRLLLNNGAYEADCLVYCGDIRTLSKAINIEDNELHYNLELLTSLPSNGTSNVLCETDNNDLSWLYLPDKKFKAHRIIYTGNFSDTNNAPDSRKSCVVEFSGKCEIEFMNAELELLPGNLKPIAYNYEPNSYIIHNKETRATVAKAKELLAKYNIFLLGRFAEWEYHNMDRCIETALDLSKNLNSR